MVKMVASFREVKIAVIETTIRCLGAGRKRWDKDNERFSEEVDYPTRLKAAEQLWTRMEGKPPETQLNINAEIAAGRGLGADDAINGIVNPEIKRIAKELQVAVDQSLAERSGKRKTVVLANPST